MSRPGRVDVISKRWLEGRSKLYEDFMEKYGRRYEEKGGRKRKFQYDFIVVEKDYYLKEIDKKEEKTNLFFLFPGRGPNGP